MVCFAFKGHIDTLLWLKTIFDKEVELSFHNIYHIRAISSMISRKSWVLHFKMILITVVKLLVIDFCVIDL